MWRLTRRQSEGGGQSHQSLSCQLSLTFFPMDPKALPVFSYGNIIESALCSSQLLEIALYLCLIILVVLLPDKVGHRILNKWVRNAVLSI